MGWFNELNVSRSFRLNSILTCFMKLLLKISIIIIFSNPGQDSTRVSLTVRLTWATQGWSLNAALYQVTFRIVRIIRIILNIDHQVVFRIVKNFVARWFSGLSGFAELSPILLTSH